MDAAVQIGTGNHENAFSLSSSAIADDMLAGYHLTLRGNFLLSPSVGVKMAIWKSVCGTAIGFTALKHLNANLS